MKRRGSLPFHAGDRFYRIFIAQIRWGHLAGWIIWMGVGGNSNKKHLQEISSQWEYQQPCKYEIMKYTWVWHIFPYEHTKYILVWNIEYLCIWNTEYNINSCMKYDIPSQNEIYIGMKYEIYIGMKYEIHISMKYILVWSMKYLLWIPDLLPSFHSNGF